jgi:hypothetical protein
MATYSVKLAPNNASNATFQAWAAGVATALTTVGITRTTNTGDTNDFSIANNWNPANITMTVPASNSFTYYEIRQFTDSLQGTNPVYLKFEYGTGDGTSYYGLRITMGGGTNGSGTLTGFTSTSCILQPAAAASATTYDCYFSSDGARLSILLFAGLTSVSSAYTIGRTVSSTFVPNSNGVNICAASSGGTTTTATNPIFQQYVSEAGQGGANPSSAQIQFTCAFNPVTNNQWGLNWGVLPIYPNVGYSDYPDCNMLVFIAEEYGGISESPVSITLYNGSTPHTYIWTNTMKTSVMTTPISAFQYNVFVRYE